MVVTRPVGVVVARVTIDAHRRHALRLGSAGKCGRQREGKRKQDGRRGSTMEAAMPGHGEKAKRRDQEHNHRAAGPPLMTCPVANLPTRISGGGGGGVFRRPRPRQSRFACESEPVTVPESTDRLRPNLPSPAGASGFDTARRAAFRGWFAMPDSYCQATACSTRPAWFFPRHGPASARPSTLPLRVHRR